MGAITLFDGMSLGGPRPDLVTYSSAAMDGAFQIVASMCEDLHTPDVFTYGALINGSAKRHKWKQALSLLDEMKEEDVEPNMFTYTSVIGACEGKHEWQVALELLGQAQTAVAPGLDAVTYNLTISAC